MSSAPSPSHQKCDWHAVFILLALALVGAAGVMTGCGGGGPATGPIPNQNTQVTLAISGTANDQLTEFDLDIQSLTLTTKSGKTVNLISAAQPMEFIHINGQIEPLITVSTPQGVYTSATATLGGGWFSCATLTPAGGIDTTEFGYSQTPTAAVNLAQPITVEGDTTALSLSLLTQQSASYSACYLSNGNYVYAITPTFNLTPAVFSSRPTNSANGKVAGLNGEVSSVDTAANSFVLSLPGPESGRTITVSSTGSTVYQGIASFSGLAVGTFVNMDGAIQPDSSLSATRIAVEDPTATIVVTGQLMFISEAEPALMLWGNQQQGGFCSNNFVGGGQYFSFGNTAFQISGQLANVQDLPFVPSFNSSNMVAGQNVYLTGPPLSLNGGFPYSAATTITLIPQTIDGTVSGSSTVGNFSVYTVNLASYDLFPTFAVQAGQTTLLNNPGEVQVYVDSSTQQINSQPLASGSTLRFYGLVFNDNGTLRMDCAQISDGVSETPAQPSASEHLENGQVTIMPSRNLGPFHQTIQRITPKQ